MNPERPRQLPFEFVAPESPISPREPYLHRIIAEVPDRPQMRSPADVAGYLMDNIYVPWESVLQEEFWVLPMDAKNRVTHQYLVYKGTIDTIHVRVGEVFREAIKVNARQIMVSHCHPSGDPEPSPEDVRLTGLLFDAGDLLDCKVMDHVIVGNRQWVSLKERGWGFK